MISSRISAQSAGRSVSRSFLRSSGPSILDSSDILPPSTVPARVRTPNAAERRAIRALDRATDEPPARRVYSPSREPRPGRTGRVRETENASHPERRLARADDHEPTVAPRLPRLAAAPHAQRAGCTTRPAAAGDPHRPTDPLPYVPTGTRASLAAAHADLAFRLRSLATNDSHDRYQGPLQEPAHCGEGWGAATDVLAPRS